MSTHCTKIWMQSIPYCTAMVKIEVANTQSQFVLKQFLVFPEHCAFCLCEVFDALPSIYIFVWDDCSVICLHDNSRIIRLWSMPTCNSNYEYHYISDAFIDSWSLNARTMHQKVPALLTDTRTDTRTVTVLCRNSAGSFIHVYYMVPLHSHNTNIMLSHGVNESYSRMGDKFMLFIFNCFFSILTIFENILIVWLCNAFLIG